VTEAVSSDGSPFAKPIPRPRSVKPATVSTSALAAHLDCSRAYIGKLEAEGVIQRQVDGFPLDQSRVAYLRYLRREHRLSPRGEADAAHVAVMLQLRLIEKKRELVRPGGCRCPDRRHLRHLADVPQAVIVWPPLAFAELDLPINGQPGCLGDCQDLTVTSQQRATCK
jgi:hypothetical protein